MAGEPTFEGMGPAGPPDPGGGGDNGHGRGAYDAIRPPPMDLIDDCVHCGFCLPTCPTYTLWNEEMDSPRGRIVIMKSGHEEGKELTATMVKHVDQCLGCMACVTACPSGVQYDKLLIDTRAQIERNYPRSAQEKAVRRLLFETFPHPARIRALAPGLRLYKRLGLDRVVERSGVLRMFPRLKMLEQLAPDVPLRDSFKRLPAHVPARDGKPRARIGVLQGCVQRVYFGDVNAATARVLHAEGFELAIPSEPRCCGSLMQHTGFDEPAIELAKETIVAFEGCDLVAVNAAGCGSGMKDYPHLFRDDPEWSERADAFAAKVRDVSELLTEFEPIAKRHPVDLRLAYHDACHLAHAQQVRSQPRKLLSDIPGLELLEPAEWEICCGSAGVYNIINPEPAAELGRRKAANLLATNAHAIAAANPGCTLQISATLEDMGRSLPTFHPIQLLDMSIAGGASDPLGLVR